MSALFEASQALNNPFLYTAFNNFIESANPLLSNLKPLALDKLDALTRIHHVATGWKEITESKVAVPFEKRIAWIKNITSAVMAISNLVAQTIKMDQNDSFARLQFERSRKTLLSTLTIYSVGILGVAAVEAAIFSLCKDRTSLYQ